MNYQEERRRQKNFDKPLPKERFSKINKVSLKRQTENEIYFERRRIFLAANKFCQARLKNCTKKATQVHHKKGRVGKNFLDEETWLPVCGGCHNFLELNPDMAKSMGLSASRIVKN